MSDPIEQFKAAQRESWSKFAPFEMTTCLAAPALVRFAGVRAGQRVLDVGCGTGVVAVTAARQGAQVSGLDLTPELLQRAKENAQIAGVEIEWREGDVEKLPYADATFDVVLSQYGHMFAPRPEIATREMLRVLKPGGTIAFSTWPPDLYTGRMFKLTGSFMPPPPPGIAAPPQWGDPNIVRERLGQSVKDLSFTMSTIAVAALSPQHARMFMEQNAGPVIKLVQMLAAQPDRLASYRKQLDDLTAQYFDNNCVRQDFLITRAVKA